MTEGLKNAYRVLNERNHTLVVCEYKSEELRSSFDDMEFLPRNPLVAFCRISDEELIQNFIADYDIIGSFVVSSALAKIGFAYFDATICVGIQRTNDSYKITTYDSYNNSEYSTSIPVIDNSKYIDDIIDFIALDIECRSNLVEDFKTKNFKKRTK